MTRIADAVALAAPGFSGQLLRPDDPGYDERRRVHNGLIDRHPAAIAACGGVTDVVEALGIARTPGLEVAVRGGGSEQGEATFQSVKAFGSPIVDAMGPIAYTTLNTMIDPAFPKAARNYWKAQFLTELTDDAIRALIDAFEKSPSPLSHIIIEHVHGAASRVPVTATACSMRTTGFNVVIASQWWDASSDHAGLQWARETFTAMQPYLAPMRYVNYLEDDALDAASVAYGPNLHRLRAIKTTYDPENVFRHNVNIPPH